MEYKILEGDKASLEQQVNACLKDGWNLHGSGYCANQTHYQPVCKGGEIIAEARLGSIEPVEHKTTVVLDASDLVKALEENTKKVTALLTKTADKK